MNEFEVHNAEEAILLFLEQDQDITLTVARPLKVSIPRNSQGNWLKQIPKRVLLLCGATDLFLRVHVHMLVPSKRGVWWSVVLGCHVWLGCLVNSLKY